MEKEKGKHTGSKNLLHQIKKEEKEKVPPPTKVKERSRRVRSIAAGRISRCTLKEIKETKKAFRCKKITSAIFFAKG